MVKHLNSTGPVQYASALTELVRATAFGSRIVDWLHLRFPNKCLYSLQLHPYRAHCTRRCKVQRSFYIICTHVCAAAIYINATKLRGMMVKSMYIHTNICLCMLFLTLWIFLSRPFSRILALSFVRAQTIFHLDGGDFLFFHIANARFLALQPLLMPPFFYPPIQFTLK